MGKHEELKRLKAQIQALLKAMDAASAATTPDHGKWYGFRSYATAYNRIAEGFSTATGQSVNVFNTGIMKNPFDMVWPACKMLFEQIYTETLHLSSLIEADLDFQDDEAQQLADQIKARLRSMFFAKPQTEREVQDNLERMFVGQGLSRGVNYDRESGRVKFSAK